MAWDGQLIEGSDGERYMYGDWLEEVDRRYFKEYLSRSGLPLDGYLARELRDETSRQFQNLIVRLWKKGGGSLHLINIFCFFLLFFVFLFGGGLMLL